VIYARRHTQELQQIPVGRCANRSGLPDVAWLRPDGKHMTDHDWHRDDTRALAAFLNGREIPHHDRGGQPVA